MPASLRPIVLSLSSPLTALGAAALLLAACGGKVVVDADNTGGASSTTGAVVTTGAGGTIQTGPATGAGGGPDCKGLLDNLQHQLDLAQACDPTVNSLQCTGALTVLDACACVTVAGPVHPEAIAAAGQAFNQWTGTGCGPFLCDHCPPPPSSPWFCDATSMKCMPAFEK